MWFIINIKQFRDWSWLLDICRKYLTIFIILLNYFFFLYSRIYIYYSLHDTLLFRYSFSFKRKPLDAKFISQPKDTHFDKNICPLTLSTILELVESNNYAYRISVFPTGTGVTYFMPRLDTQIIEKSIKRRFEESSIHRRASVRDRETGKSIAISCEKRRENGEWPRCLPR